MPLLLNSVASEESIDPDSHLTELALVQHGVVTRAQLREGGLSRAKLRHLIDRGWLIPVTTEVLRLIGAPPSRGQSAATAVLDAGPGAVLSYRSGASWWRVSGCQLKPIEVARIGRSSRGSDLARIHNVRLLSERWTTVLDGIPIARPELVALHLFATCRYEQAERWVERLWSLRLLSSRSLSSLLTEMGRSGRNGTTALRRYLDDRGHDYVPPASNVESRTLQILQTAGIAMRCQVDIGGDSWTGRVDFYHHIRKVVLEVQSEMYHTALVDRIADLDRLDKLRSNGVTVVEATDTEVFHRPWVVVQRVRAALESGST
ncbi:MAG: type IV toxin-antitoxin system AbiEi family antitoxin domain-containing protein [Microthrixaceae bacterium]